jgi:ubiquinone/menaquinone biosynthesis C-methylase UbiE
MENQATVKEIVKQKYGAIAEQSKTSQNKCGCGCQSTKKIVDYTIMSDDYSNLDGYAQDADLGLGCGLPTEFANITEGDKVLDLGAGAGNDVFVASKIVGDSGHVIGIDMTEEMIGLANKNKSKLEINNVDFKLGEIEKLPIENNSTDVVISNCVLNLVPNKEKAFSEIFRVIRDGGHFCVSDIVIVGDLPEGLRKSSEMYAGCIAGAVQKNEYLEIIKNTGFNNIEIKQSKTITIPDEILNQYLSDQQLIDYKQSNIGIFSITVVAQK